MFMKILLFTVLSIAILLSTVGCETMNSLRMMQINSDAAPVFTSQQTIQLKTADLDEKPYVYATVNGQELLFLVDTGARFLVLMDTPKVKALNLKAGFKLSMGGWGDQQDSQAYQVDIQRMDLGGVHFDNLKAAFIPTSKSHYFLREDEAIFDGVIGHDMMRHFSWVFDPSHNKITISSQPYQPEQQAQRLPMDNFFSKVSVAGELAFNSQQQSQTEFIIDTGSRHYVKISNNYLLNRDIEVESSRVRAADFGLSGKTEHDRVNLPSLKLGSIELDNIKVNLIPNQDEDDLWIIGNALMNQFKTVIDYQSEAFYLVPQQPFTTQYNLLGLELRKIRSGAFVVRYVFPNLPSSLTDIQVGDVITQIDGKPASDLSLKQYNQIATTLGDHQLCIERRQQCFAVNAQVIAGYSSL